MKSKSFNNGLDRKEENFPFPEIDLHYTQSQEDVWGKLLPAMEVPCSDKRTVPFSPILRMALAASFLMLIGIAGFMRIYTRTVYTTGGQHLTLCLPDSSVIELNAQSDIRYHPYWYWLSRTVTLNGEAFFKVNSGNRFKVFSESGETTVMGTSFNIYARDNNYSVTCFTGKVRVVSAGKSERVLLNPNEQAFINKDGFLRFVQEANTHAVNSWMDNMFVFTGSSVISVLREIERQYNIKIVFKADPNLTYTGNFSKSLTEKEVLNLVCTSLGLTFEAKSGSEFLVD
jgi:transmembrane sensor